VAGSHKVGRLVSTVLDDSTGFLMFGKTQDVTALWVQVPIECDFSLLSHVNALNIRVALAEKLCEIRDDDAPDKRVTTPFGRVVAELGTFHGRRLTPTECISVVPSVLSGGGAESRGCVYIAMGCPPGEGVRPYEGQALTVGEVLAAHATEMDKARDNPQKLSLIGFARLQFDELVADDDDDDDDSDGEDAFSGDEDEDSVSDGEGESVSTASSDE
jgi:hypothetical protein